MKVDRESIVDKIKIHTQNEIAESRPSSNKKTKKNTETQHNQDALFHLSYLPIPLRTNVHRKFPGIAVKVVNSYAAASLLVPVRDVRSVDFIIRTARTEGDEHW